VAKGPTAETYAECHCAETVCRSVNAMERW